MKIFAEIIVKYRIVVIGIILLATLFFGYQLKDLKVNSDIVSYLKPNDPAVVLFNRVGEEYSGTALAMVGIQSDDVFEYNTLTTINKLTEEFKQIDGVASVMSLTDILDIKSVDGGLEVGRLINKNNIPTDKAELESIRNYALSKDMYNGSVISPDGKITVIIARLKQESDKIAIADEMTAVAQRDANDFKLYFSGMPMQMTELSDIIISDMVWLIPIVALMLVLVLYFSFRSKRDVILPLLTVFISTVWALGLMTMVGVELSMISNLMPVILIAVGSAYGIHMISRYNEDIAGCNDSKECVKKSLSEVGFSIVLAGVTTLIGFLSFTGAYLTAVTDFGIFTGIGVGFALLVSITLIPAILSFLSAPKVKRTDQGKEDITIARTMDAIAEFVLKNEKIIVISSLVIIVVALIGLPNLKRQANMTEYFSDDTDIRIAEIMMQENFGGSIPVQIVVSGDLKDPFVLKEIRKLEKYMETVPFVGKPQSIASLICEMNRVMNGHYTIPDTREGVTNLWFFIESESVMKQLVSANSDEGIIQANLGTMDTKHINQTVDLINDYIINNIREPIIAIKNVDFKKHKSINDFIIKEIAIQICLDDLRYQDSCNIDQNRLKSTIREIASIGKVNYSEATINELDNRLQDFFDFESEIEIENANSIDRIIKETIKSLNKYSIPGEKNLQQIIKSNVSRSVARDSEGIELTEHSLNVILTEYYQKEKILAGVEKIIPLFPNELRDNQKFKDDLRDDLWLLNENNFAIKKGLADANKLKGEEIEIGFIQTGMPIIFTHMDDSLIKSQFQSIVIAIALVALLLMVQLRSFVGGLIAVTPIIVTVLLNFAVMSYLNVPLDIATILVASIAIGVGIDYTIHFTNRFKEEYKKEKSQLKAMEKTLESTGKAILINALSVAMGFIVLLFAQLIPIQRFGWLTATTMVFSAAGAITFLPALILITKAKFINGMKKIEK